MRVQVVIPALASMERKVLHRLWFVQALQKVCSFSAAACWALQDHLGFSPSALVAALIWP